MEGGTGFPAMQAVDGTEPQQRTSPDGGGGGSTFQAEETAQKQADLESACHAAG